MKICSYLRLSRHNIYVYRRRIPKNIQDICSTSEIRQSLYTSDYKLAKSLARILTAEVEKHFLNLHMNKNTTPKFSTLIDLVTYKKEAMKYREIIDNLNNSLLDKDIEHKKNAIAANEVLNEPHSFWRSKENHCSRLGFALWPERYAAIRARSCYCSRLGFALWPEPS